MFPIADLRGFFAPDGSNAAAAVRRNDGSVFLRRFGPAAYRLGDAAAGGRIPQVLAHNESWFVSGRRFAHVLAHQLVAPRLFLDGLISARLEIIVAPPAPAEGQSLEDWLRAVLKTPVEVRASRKDKRSPERTAVPLGELGPRFRRAFVAATTPEPHRTAARAREPSAVPSHVQSLEPLLILLNGARGSAVPTHAVSSLRTGTADFRALTLWVAGDPLHDRSPAARLVRRTFVRLHAQAAAIRRLADAWDQAPPATQPADATLRGLGALADTLHDGTDALVDRSDPIAPLADTIRDAADAADRLYRLLDAIDPDVARRQYRLARRLTQIAQGGGVSFVTIDSIIGQQGMFTMAEDKAAAGASGGFTFTNTNSTVGAQGNFQGGTFTQNLGPAQLPQLATDLGKLQDQLGQVPDLPDAEATTAAITEAQAAAADDNYDGVLAALGRISGKALEKVLEVATDVAAKVAVAYLKQASGTV